MNPNQNTPPSRTHLAPLRIADETFVIQDHQGEGTAPVVVHLNSMLIRGEQPVVVDTGVPTNREQYLTDLFNLVEPEDVRWVFLSHDDVDHTGNVEAVMNACPNATLITTWFTMERMQGEPFAVPPSRWRWLADGEPLDIGDRSIVALRPPLYDSPTSRALLDTRTGAYWAADCFAAPVPTPTYEASELDVEVWIEGFNQFQQWNSPWIDSLDLQKWHRTVDQFQALGVSAIASCHGPAVHGDRMNTAVAALRDLPNLPVAPQPGQELLDMIVASMQLAPN